MDELGLQGTNKDPKVCRGTDRWDHGCVHVCCQLGDSSVQYCGWVIPSMPGSCPGLSSWKLPRSWASCPGLTCFQDGAAPTGGNPGSWWGLEQLAAEADSEVSGSQGMELGPWAFPASNLCFKPPRVGKTRLSSFFNSFSVWEVLSAV